MPKKLVNELLRIMPDEGEISLQVYSQLIVASWGEAKLISKLIDGTYPDYQRVIPTPEHRIVVDRKRLIEAVGRVSVVLEAKGQTGVNLVTDPEGLKIQAQSHERGKGFDEIDALIEGPQITIGMNFRYLLDELAAMETDQVEIQFSDPHTPLLLRPDGADGEMHRMVLMPMRTDMVSDDMKEAA